MNNLFTLFLTPLLVASVVASAVELSAVVRTSRLQSADRVLAQSPVEESGTETANLFVTSNAYEEASAYPLVDREIAYQSARLLYRAGLLEPDSVQRIQFFCRALGQVGSALKRNPTSSRLLINWANLRQLLSQVSCPQPLTNGDYEQVTRYALVQDPTNADVLFSSAQILLWAGKRDEALSQFKAFLELEQSVSARQAQFIEQQLLSPEDIVAVIPPRFPQIVEWNQRLHARHATLLREAAAEISRLQLGAMAASDASFKSGEIPTQLYFDRLSALLEVVDSSSVRQTIDAELSRYYGTHGQERLQRYLDRRRLATTLDVVRATSRNDTRPHKSPLVLWEPEGAITANNFYTSIGFFLPRGSMVELIEVVGDARSALIPNLSFKLFASDDNQSWEEITGKVTVESLEFARHARLAWTVPPMNFRYWKVHFSSPSREGTFSNQLDRLLRVYGRTVTQAEVP